MKLTSSAVSCSKKDDVGLRGKFKPFLFVEFFIFFLRLCTFGKWCFAFLHILVGDMKYQDTIMANGYVKQDTVLSQSFQKLSIRVKVPLRYSAKNIIFLQVSGYGPSMVYLKKYGLVMVYHALCLLFFLYLAIIIL
ncbi:hypothetical protein B9X85_00505 [Acinetobacter baumannii]|nr:hypothetical protein B9X85_00505 [Acinetobacter baumannii]HAV5534642.1 hypothetical protein [Acinetobacter baumannii]